jgi:Flp pilus assembly protein TadG
MPSRLGRDPATRERGAVAVEFALSMLALLPLVLGGMHIGRVLAARHRLGDAVGVATRQAAIGGTPSGAQVRAIMTDRLGGDMKECTSMLVSASTVGGPPYRRFEVKATCLLEPPFGASFLEDVGPTEFSVSAAFPY